MLIPRMAETSRRASKVNVPILKRLRELFNLYKSYSYNLTFVGEC